MRVKKTIQSSIENNEPTDDYPDSTDSRDPKCENKKNCEDLHESKSTEDEQSLDFESNNLLDHQESSMEREFLDISEKNEDSDNQDETLEIVPFVSEK